MAGAVLAAVSLAAVLVVVLSASQQRIDMKAAIASLGPATNNRMVLTPGTYAFQQVVPRYLRRSRTLGRRPAWVAEIDVLVPRVGKGVDPCLDGQDCELFPTTERHSEPPGFRLLSRRFIAPFTVMRYVTNRAELLDFSEVDPYAPGGFIKPPLILYQPASP